MRPWIAHLISNTHALNDFKAYVAEIASDLNKKLTQCVRDGKLEEARNLAYEIKVYEDLGKGITHKILKDIEISEKEFKSWLQ